MAAVTQPEIGLWRSVLGAKHFLSLSTPSVTVVRRAIQDIYEFVEVEQKFDILVANFLELEEEMARRSLVQAYYADHSAKEMFEDKQAFNRRVINVLTAARLYVDQIMQHVKAFFPDDAVKEAELKSAIAAEYDSRLGYRVMEALRNYTQHRGLPLQGFTHGSRWVNPNSPDKELEYNVALNLVASELEADGKFKKATLAELKAIGGTIDLKPLARDYLEGLGTIHQAFRTMVKDKMEKDGLTLEKVRTEFIAGCTEDHPTVGLTLAERHENGTFTVIERYPKEALEYLEVLKGRTGNFINYSRRIVTTRPLNLI